MSWRPNDFVSDSLTVFSQLFFQVILESPEEKDERMNI